MLWFFSHWQCFLFWRLCVPSGEHSSLLFTIKSTIHSFKSSAALIFILVFQMWRSWGSAIWNPCEYHGVLLAYLCLYVICWLFSGGTMEALTEHYWVLISKQANAWHLLSTNRWYGCSLRFIASFSLELEATICLCCCRISIVCQCEFKSCCLITTTKCPLKAFEPSHYLGQDYSVSSWGSIEHHKWICQVRSHWPRFRAQVTTFLRYPYFLFDAPFLGFPETKPSIWSWCGIICRSRGGYTMGMSTTPNTVIGCPKITRMLEISMK